MSLEQECRRKPDIEGIPVRLRNGEDWLIPLATVEPVFEKEDGQWMFRYLGVGEPYKKHFKRILEIKNKLGENLKKPIPEDKPDAKTDPDGLVFMEFLDELTKETLELTAMALDTNYDLTADQLGQVIDPQNQPMLGSVLSALRGIDLSAPDDTSEDEKKKDLSG